MTPDMTLHHTKTLHSTRLCQGPTGPQAVGQCQLRSVWEEVKEKEEGICNSFMWTVCSEAQFQMQMTPEQVMAEFSAYERGLTESLDGQSWKGPLEII